MRLNAQALSAESKIEVLVYNYADAPAGILARAERGAARIYSRTGVETEWLDCRLSPDPRCALVTPARLVLRILSASMDERTGVSGASLGSALSPDEGGFATFAQVCWPCVEKLAEGREGMKTAILSHVMAHELGHLLLGIGSHGATGLMHVPWCKKDLEDIAQGLVFTPREGEKIRAQVSARLLAAAPSR